MSSPGRPLLPCCTSLPAARRAAAWLPALLAVAGCASPPPPGTRPSPPSTDIAIPAALQPPAGERRAFEHHARGVQIYRCTLAADATAPAWTFVAPEADLYATAAMDVPVGRHGGGPYWQSLDGSRVNGQVKARADAPQAGAIPWLLLATTSTGGAGAMASVRSVQRVQTVGGVAPAAGCTTAADVGREARVPYTARYVYWTGS